MICSRCGRPLGAAIPPGARAPACPDCSVRPFIADPAWTGPTIEAVAFSGARGVRPTGQAARSAFGARPSASTKPAPPARAAAAGPRSRLAYRVGLSLVLAVAVAGGAYAVQRTVYRAVIAAVGLTPAYGGFAFRAVRSTTRGSGDASALIVEGELVNLTEHDAALPAIRLSLQDGGAEIYGWSVALTRDSLAPGETIAFRSMVPAPASAAGTVVASLAAPAGRIIGLR